MVTRSRDIIPLLEAAGQRKLPDKSCTLCSGTGEIPVSCKSFPDEHGVISDIKWVDRCTCTHVPKHINE